MWAKVTKFSFRPSPPDCWLLVQLLSLFSGQDIVCLSSASFSKDLDNAPLVSLSLLPSTPALGSPPWQRDLCTVVLSLPMAPPLATSPEGLRRAGVVPTSDSIFLLLLLGSTELPLLSPCISVCLTLQLWNTCCSWAGGVAGRGISGLTTCTCPLCRIWDLSHHSSCSQVYLVTLDLYILSP